MGQNGGLARVDDYPITCCDGRPTPGPITTCQNKPSKVKVMGMQTVSNERELAAPVASQGPFSVGVASSAWNLFAGEVMNAVHCTGEVDHDVQVVGFDKPAAPPYWIVRNQWGTDWGHEGYIYLAMWQNTCQIASVPGIVEVADANDMLANVVV